MTAVPSSLARLLPWASPLFLFKAPAPPITVTGWSGNELMDEEREHVTQNSPLWCEAIPPVGLLPISPCSSSNESQLPSAHWPGHVTQQLYTAVSRMLLILRLILIWHPTTTNNAPELTKRKMNSTCFLLFDFIFINRNIIKSDFKHHHANKHVFTQFHCFIFIFSTMQVVALPNLHF